MRNIEELTIAEARELIAQADELSKLFGIASPSGTPALSHSFTDGQTVFIRSVTNYYTGRVVRVTDSDVVLSEAAWIADTRRFHDMLIDGLAKDAEVEPYPDGCVIARWAIVDFCAWRHALPTKQQ